MPYSAQQHGSVALSRSQELSSTSYRIETGLSFSFLGQIPEIWFPEFPANTL